jgi:hypothetical protein
MEAILHLLVSSPAKPRQFLPLSRILTKSLLIPSLGFTTNRLSLPRPCNDVKVAKLNFYGSPPSYTEYTWPRVQEGRIAHLLSTSLLK